MIYEAVDPNANIIFGALVDESMNGEIAITVIATGFPVMSTADSMKGTYVTLNTQLNMFFQYIVCVVRFGSGLKHYLNAS